MTNTPDQPDPALEAIRAVEGKGPLTKAAAYTKLTGPGWLQGAVTLGGGSLAGSLYLGIIAGTGMLWVQPLAMLLGVVMLAALTYVTLSTNERPLGLINRHVSPVLGWGWVLATFLTTLIWDMPQFNLARAAIQQNLLPAVGEGTVSTFFVCLAILIGCGVVVWFYDSGRRGIQIFETILKIMVATVVISFFGVVISLSMSGRLNWGSIVGGFAPHLELLREPAAGFQPILAGIDGFQEQWRNFIVTAQRDRIITGLGAAVGVNMTFLLPYSLLAKRWGKPHRGLAIYDLSIGLFVPFLLATSCLVIAAAAQFFVNSSDILDAEGRAKPQFAGLFNEIADKRLAWEHTGYAKLPVEEKQRLRDALPLQERQLSAMLTARDTRSLALSLEPFSGRTVSQLVFGIGVLGMAVSTIVIHMLMAGMALSEIVHRRDVRTTRLIGSAICGVAGFMGPFLWTGASKAALAIPATIISSAFLPLAYFAFLLMMNSPRILGDAMPRGGKRVVWNTLMILSTGVTTLAIIWGIRGNQFAGIPVGTIGITFLLVMFVVGFIGFLRTNRSAA